MKAVQGQRRLLSNIVWRHRSLHGPCVVLKTKTVQVKVLGEPPELCFFLLRKPRRPLLITILKHVPASPRRPPSKMVLPGGMRQPLPPVPPQPEVFIPTAAMTRSAMDRDLWRRGRKATQEAARKQGLPPTLIDDIYPKDAQMDIISLRKRYPKWPIIGSIQLHVALQKKPSQTNLVLLSGSRKSPVVVATAGKPLDPDIYTAPPTVVWTTSSTKHNLLNFGLGQAGLPSNRQEAKKMFRWLDLDVELVDIILD
jgi:hypothetical protein